jgi:hypothetical protein
VIGNDPNLAFGLIRLSATRVPGNNLIIKIKKKKIQPNDSEVDDERSSSDT